MRQQERAGWLGLGFGVGLALGVGVGWLTAGQSGPRLRAELGQRLDRALRAARERAARRSRDLAHRAQGAASRARSRVTGGSHYVDGPTLVDQVRSRLGREFNHELNEVNLHAVGHRIYLHGTLGSEAEKRRFVSAMAALDGVEAVEAGHLRVGPLAEERRESGLPGGGAGRRDRVDRTGVYPFSGPAPENVDEIRTQKSWGQGERGDAGYDDSGRSELIYDKDSGQVLGGLDEPAASPERRPKRRKPA